MQKKILRYFVLFFGLIFTAQSQSDSISANVWQIKPTFNTGFLMVHRIGIGHLVKGYPTIYELNVSKTTNGSKIWQLENNKPDIGLSVQCIDFRNPEQLGYALSVVPYVEIPLSKQERVSRMILRLCFGATYVTKHFDISTNHKNIAVGSALNAYVQFKWFWHLKINSQLRFEPGFTFTHLSNGRSNVPNLGLNIFSVNAGINYQFKHQQKLKLSIDSSTRAKSKHEVILISAIGPNQINVNGPHYRSFLLSAAYQFNKRNTHKFSAGIDFFYDEIYQIDSKHLTGRDNVGFEKLRMSARLGYSYNVGRVSFPIEIGYYIYNTTVPDATVVSRIGVRYYSASGLIGHFGLRTHYAVAYNFEYGIGYRFILK